MPRKKSATTGTSKSEGGFTTAEMAAMKERVREIRARPRAGTADGERDVLAKIAGMQPSDRAMAKRIHAIIHTHAPTLTSRTWYGMPAYVKDGQVLCFFRAAEKFGTRYATLGFSDEANLDDGHMWPTDFALTELTAPEEARIAALVKKAVRGSSASP
ncbi:MAG: DUF1801 domain-containing protein [Thermoplasmata archaeon]|jgi:uncharacterized protein YdhG (YjbR/CyaY superfamily)|nr:DUF1801 domain-containing protein [Thermoplasmata archaeon]